MICARAARDLRLGDVALTARLIDVGLAGQILGAQPLDAREVHLRRRERGLRAPELRLGGGGLRSILLDRRAEQRGVDFGEHVPLLHHGIEVDEDFRDPPRNLRANLHLGQRLHRARRLHRFDDVALRDRRKDVLRLRRGLV
jgi:hypothetical protein